MCITQDGEKTCQLQGCEFMNKYREEGGQNRLQKGGQAPCVGLKLANQRGVAPLSTVFFDLLLSH